MLEALTTYIAVIVGRIITLLFCIVLFGLPSSLTVAGVGTLLTLSMYKKPKAVYLRLFHWAAKGSAISGFSCSLLLFLAFITNTSNSRDGLSVAFSFSENDVFNFLAVLVLVIAVPSGAIMGGLIKLSSLNLPRRNKAMK